MKTNKGLNILMGKKLAKARGYTEMPKGYTLGKLLDEGGEASKEELVQVGKDITKFYEDKIKELEKQIKPVKQKDFKDFILEEVDEQFYEEKNELSDGKIMGCNFETVLVRVKADFFWEKSDWYDYTITIGKDEVEGNRLL